MQVLSVRRSVRVGIKYYLLVYVRMLHVFELYRVKKKNKKGRRRVTCSTGIPRQRYFLAEKTVYLFVSRVCVITRANYIFLNVYIGIHAISVLLIIITRRVYHIYKYIYMLKRYRVKRTVRKSYSRLHTLEKKKYKSAPIVIGYTRGIANDLNDRLRVVIN